MDIDSRTGKGTASRAISLGFGYSGGECRNRSYSGAASLVAAGRTSTVGVVSTEVAAPTERMLKAMLMSKLNAVIAIVLVPGFMAIGAIVFACHTAAAQRDKPPIAEKPRANRGQGVR
jgi:hypothetical protein